MSTDKKNNSHNGALAGLRVLDLSRILAGPTCTQLLGDYGADIIKVERPGLGDDTRAWGPPYVTDDEGKVSNESAYFLATNRNKRSLAVDIASEDGADVIRRLVKHCDIMVENFKTGGLKKYGLDYDSLKEISPRLIYCSITGFGQTGPNAHQAGYDLLAQAYGGIMSITGDADGEPMKVGVAVADVMCGMYAATAILAALRYRDETGIGQHIDLGLVDTQISWLINAGTNYLMSGTPSKRRGNTHPNIVPYEVFAAKDSHLVIAAGNDGQFARLCGILNRDDLAENPDYASNQMRLKNREKLTAILDDEISSWQASDLLKAMAAEQIPSGVINSIEDVFATDQVAARGMKINMPHPEAGKDGVDLIGNPVKFSKTAVSYRRPPPICGEHNDEILAELKAWEKGKK